MIWLLFEGGAIELPNSAAGGFATECSPKRQNVNHWLMGKHTAGGHLKKESRTGLTGPPLKVPGKVRRYCRTKAPYLQGCLGAAMKPAPLGGRFGIVLVPLTCSVQDSINKCQLWQNGTSG